MRTVCVVVPLAVAGCGTVSHAEVVPPASGAVRARHRRTQTRKPTSGNAPTVAGPPPIPPSDRDVFTSPSVAGYLARSAINITAAVYNEVSGHTSVYRSGVAQDTGSIVKVDILATLLAQAQAASSSLTSWQQELSEEMIENSYNDAAQDLWDAAGGATAIANFDTEAGLRHTLPDPQGEFGLTTTTAADQVALLKKVAYPNRLLTDTSRRYLLGLMTEVEPDQAWGVSAGVPAGVTVALKNGWLALDAGGWQINSIGYIHGDGRDYLIAVLTNGNTTEADGIDTIEGLSRLVWQTLRPHPLPRSTPRHADGA